MNDLAGTPDVPASAAAPDAVLRALRFSPSDLKANREGRISGSQRRTLWFEDWVLLLAAGVMLAIGLGFLASGALGYMNPAPLGLGVGAGFVLIALVVGMVGGPMWRDLAAGAVRSVSGRITPDIVTNAQSMFYVWKIRGRTFTVPESAFDAVGDGGEYTVYYLPRSEKVLSAERAPAAAGGNDL